MCYGKLPLYFEGNTGQTDPQVRFLARGPGYTLFLTRRAEALLVLRKPETQHIPPARMSLSSSDINMAAKA